MKALTIIGRRWFERTNGNTYHSVEVYVDGVKLTKIPLTYGYGTQYLQTARDFLEVNKLLPGITDNTVLWRYCEESGIALVDSVTDVQRKRDL